MHYFSVLFRAVSILFLMTASMRAMQPGPRMYNGHPITPESIAGLMPKMPNDSYTACMSWIEQHAAIFKNMLAPSEPPSRFAAHQQEVKKQLADAGVKNLSNWNFVVEPTPGYFMHVAGPINRICNLLAHNDKSQAVNYTPEELDAAIKNRPHTYQTVSVAAHYLLCAQAIEKEKTQRVIVPQTYLISSASPAHDGNSCIVQEAIPTTAKAFKDLTHEQRANIPLAAINDMLMLIKQAGLWDTTQANVLYDQSKQAFYVTDIEQPNNSNPVDFFHKNREKYMGNVGCGIEQFADLFRGVPGALQTIDEFVTQDPDLKACKTGESLHAHIAQLLVK